jgi:cytochrome c oxidase subunit 1
MVYCLLSSLFRGKKAPPNPWGSAALEWQTPTPPPVYNFVTDPVITRGPYDYHLATDAELFEGFPEDAVKHAEKIEKKVGRNPVDKAAKRALEHDDDDKKKDEDDDS